MENVLATSWEHRRPLWIDPRCLHAEELRQGQRLAMGLAHAKSVTVPLNNQQSRRSAHDVVVVA